MLSLDYDERSRGGAVETDIEAAAQACMLQRRIVDSLDLEVSPSAAARLWERPLAAVFLADAGTGVSYSVPTTFERELSFCAHHATHHLAMSRLMLESTGSSVALDGSIGMANSTARHQKSDQD